MTTISHRIRALIVDDEQRNYDVDSKQLRANLRDYGIDLEVEYCPTVEDALSMLDVGQDRYQLVISDLLFAHRSGRRPRWDVITQAAKTDGVVVVALTLGDSPDHHRLEQRALDEGAHLFAYRSDLVGDDRSKRWDEFCREIYDSLVEVGAVVGQSDRVRRPRVAQQIADLFASFPSFVRALAKRRSERPPFVIADEYDLQYLFHALLTITFTDVRVEESTKQVAGKGARIDFVLPDEHVVIEMKFARDAVHAQKLASEINEDALRYRNHRECRSLVALIYDPEGYISNSAGFEHDLTRQIGDLALITIVEPKLPPHTGRRRERYG